MVRRIRKATVDEVRVPEVSRSAIERRENLVVEASATLYSQPAEAREVGLKPVGSM